MLLSELSFDYPQSADAGKTIDSAYDSLKGRMLILVENIGYYVIDNCPENLDGSVPIKNVSCSSLESELLSRRMTNFVGTYPFLELFQKVLDKIPTWTIGSVSPDLIPLYRTFGIGSTTSNNSTAYNFLTTTAAKAYGAFLFSILLLKQLMLSQILYLLQILLFI